MTTISTSRQIVETQRRHTDLLDRMQAMNDRATAENRDFTPAEAAAWRSAEAEAADLNRELVVLRGLEQQQAARARPIEHPMQQLAMPRRAVGKPFPGQAFTRLCGALAISRARFRRRWKSPSGDGQAVA